MSGPGAVHENCHPVFNYCLLLQSDAAFLGLEYRVDWALALRLRCSQRLIPDYFAHLMALSCSIP